jgi:type IV secretion system protein VirB4
MGAAIKYADALKKEVTTAAFIPYSSHVTKNVVKLANGDYI